MTQGNRRAEACIPAYVLPPPPSPLPSITYQIACLVEELLLATRWTTATPPGSTTTPESTTSFAVEGGTTPSSALGPVAALLASLDEDTHLTNIASDIDSHTTLATLVLGQGRDDRLLGSV